MWPIATVGSSERYGLSWSVSVSVFVKTDEPIKVLFGGRLMGSVIHILESAHWHHIVNMIE